MCVLHDMWFQNHIPLGLFFFPSFHEKKQLRKRHSPDWTRNSLWFSTWGLHRRKIRGRQLCWKAGKGVFILNYFVRNIHIQRVCSQKTGEMPSCYRHPLTYVEVQPVPHQYDLAPWLGQRRPVGGQRKNTGNSVQTTSKFTGPVKKIDRWVFPKIGVPQNGWFIMENPIKWMIWGYHYFRKHPDAPRRVVSNMMTI